MGQQDPRIMPQNLMPVQLHPQTNIKIKPSRLGQQTKHLNDVLNRHSMHEQHIPNQFRILKKKNQPNHSGHPLLSLETVHRCGGNVDKI